MSSLKILTAIAAAATFSLAFAQGTPPRPATNPAVGAGQRSTQNTPMGTTGTPGGSGGAMAQGSMGASGAAATTAGGAMASDTAGGSMATGGRARHHHRVSHTKHRKHRHVRKADRN